MSGPTAVTEADLPEQGERSPAFSPLPVDGDSDQALLLAVAGHYHERLMSDARRDERFAALGISATTAVRLGVGLCDRTLGLRLPDRKRVAGAKSRNALLRLGVVRDSGHEPLRGCVVIPVAAPDGEVLALCGLRGTRKPPVWAVCSGGGIFNRPAAWPERLVVAASLARHGTRAAREVPRRAPHR